MDFGEDTILVLGSQRIVHEEFCFLYMLLIIRPITIIFPCRHVEPDRHRNMLPKLQQHAQAPSHRLHHNHSPGTTDPTPQLHPVTPTIRHQLPVSINPALEFSQRPAIQFDLSPAVLYHYIPRSWALFTWTSSVSEFAIASSDISTAQAITVHASAINPAFVSVADVLGTICSAVHFNIT
jgi:hypothetical protein